MDQMYLDPHQTRLRPPTPYEDQLADAFERAFLDGAQTLEALAAALNQGGPRRQDQRCWTSVNLAQELQRLSQ
jgi:hypothetical protein